MKFPESWFYFTKDGTQQENLETKVPGFIRSMSEGANELV
jgi:hypothetical protein